MRVAVAWVVPSANVKTPPDLRLKFAAETLPPTVAFPVVTKDAPDRMPPDDTLPVAEILAEKLAAPWQVKFAAVSAPSVEAPVTFSLPVSVVSPLFVMLLAAIVPVAPFEEPADALPVPPPVEAVFCVVPSGKVMTPEVMFRPLPTVTRPETLRAPLREVSPEFVRLEAVIAPEVPLAVPAGASAES